MTKSHPVPTSFPQKITALYRYAFSWTHFIPPTLLAFIMRFALAAVFWKSGQTKIEGLMINLFSSDWMIGWPRLAEFTVDLFEDEYGFPFPVFSAIAAALAEHILPILLLFGFGTRLAALALLIMSLVIQLFVYPSAYPVHLTWIGGFLYLLKYGGGKLSLDYLFAHKLCKTKTLHYPPLR